MSLRTQAIEACRVAAARKQAARNAELADQGLWPERTSLTHEEHVDAILTTLLNPSEEMIEAAGETPGMKAVNNAMALYQIRGFTFSPDAFPDGKSPLHQAWEAMIRKALGEQG